MIKEQVKNKTSNPKATIRDVCTVVIMMTRKNNYKNKG